MGAAFFRERMEQRATFSLFVRRLPPERAFLLAAGLEDVLEYLRALCFTPAALGWLETLGRFDREFLDHLAGLLPARSGGARGHRRVRRRPILGQRPDHRGPVERSSAGASADVLAARRCARCSPPGPAAGRVRAQRTRRCRDEGARAPSRSSSHQQRARGDEYDLPLSGAMAPLWRLLDELEAFRARRAHPGGCVLLIDTYDTVAAA
jgi:nicotinate phosphoribosyltransferase